MRYKIVISLKWENNSWDFSVLLRSRARLYQINQENQLGFSGAPSSTFIIKDDRALKSLTRTFITRWRGSARRPFSSLINQVTVDRPPARTNYELLGRGARPLILKHYPLILKHFSFKSCSLRRGNFGHSRFIKLWFESRQFFLANIFLEGDTGRPDCNKIVLFNSCSITRLWFW